ncbi:cysteine desulfurase [Candidatus Woesearchaeota archaeon]|nr:cysteine desulfurase [Candidatus Woesearchaeota archaeon]
MIYLDNAATTKVDSKVVKKMLPYFEKEFGNSSSIHERGLKAKEALENSRRIIANSINANPKEIYFTSGGTESNNLAIKGIAFASRDANKENNHIITTKIEHKCVMDACKWLETQGFRVTYLNVNQEGFIDLKQLEGSITKNTILVSVIHGNNEIGTIQDIEAIGKICKKHGVLFHSDACQSFTKTEINVVNQGVDLLTINAHKIHGPKGIGALYIKEGIKITPLNHGGGQERNIRSGTENVPGIVGFAEAVKIADKKNIPKMEKLRDELIDELLKIKGTKLNGPRNNRLCNNVNISFKGIEGEAIGGDLNDNGIASSTGSACAERNLDVSYVLTAIGCSHEEGNGSLRLSLSKYTTEKEIQTILKVMPKVVQRLRSISPYGKV